MFKKLLVLGLMALFILGGSTMANAKEKWDKVFPKSDKVNIEKVTFKSRFGIELTGDLYTPKTMNKDDKLPAIAIQDLLVR